MRLLQVPGLILMGALCVAGQQQERTQQQQSTGQTSQTANQSTTQQPAPTPEQVLSQSRNNDSGTVGKIKEIDKGQKIVIAVDNARDKSYSLNDAKRKITVAEGLVMGDRVRVLESDASVQIVKDMNAPTTVDQQRSRTSDQSTATETHSTTSERTRASGAAKQRTKDQETKEGSTTQPEKRNQD